MSNAQKIDGLMNALAENQNNMTKLAMEMGTMVNNGARILTEMNQEMANLFSTAGAVTEAAHAATNAAVENAQAIARQHSDPTGLGISPTQIDLLSRVKEATSAMSEAAARARPNSVQADAGPTLVGMAGIVPAPANPAKDILLNKLIGPRSTLAMFLSPTVIEGGRGWIAPGHANLAQYQEDVATAQKSDAWPSGFYTNATTMAKQLYINTPTLALVVDNMSSPDMLIIVRNKETGGKMFVNADTIKACPDDGFAALTLVHTVIEVWVQDQAKVGVVTAGK